MSLDSQVFKGRYEIQRYLRKRPGQQTLLAQDRQTQDLVVVKLLTFGDELEWGTFKLFEREAKTLKELEHSAIPRYLDYFDIETSSGKGFALVQNHIDALSLEEHIKAGRTFSEIELKQIAKAVLEILIYLHNRHPPIIHRDIKPGNILLTNRSGNNVGQVYLVDFGSVQAAVNQGGTRTVVGTYGYMPPEQFGGRAVSASDLYGLGTTIIYLASGQHPADLPQKDLQISFESDVNLSSNFIDWLQWITQPSLGKRLESANQALEALENPTLQKNPVLVPSKLSNSRVARKKARQRQKIWILIKDSLSLLPAIIVVIIWDGLAIFITCWVIYNVIVGNWYGAFHAAFFAVPLNLTGIKITVEVFSALFGKN